MHFDQKHVREHNSNMMTLLGTCSRTLHGFPCSTNVPWRISNKILLWGAVEVTFMGITMGVKHPSVGIWGPWNYGYIYICILYPRKLKLHIQVGTCSGLFMFSQGIRPLIFQGVCPNFGNGTCHRSPPSKMRTRLQEEKPGVWTQEFQVLY